MRNIRHIPRTVAAITNKLFYLFGNNNSLEALQEIAPEAFQRVKEKKINLYGNGINWSKAWNVLNQPEKTRLIETVVNY